MESRPQLLSDLRGGESFEWRERAGRRSLRTSTKREMCIPVKCFESDAYMSNSTTGDRDIPSELAIANHLRVALYITGSHLSAGVYRFVIAFQMAAFGHRIRAN